MKNVFITFISCSPPKAAKFRCFARNTEQKKACGPLSRGKIGKESVEYGRAQRY